MKAVEHDKRRGTPLVVCGGLRDDAGNGAVESTGEFVRVCAWRDDHVQRIDAFSVERVGRRTGEVDEVGKVEAHFVTRLTEPHGIGRRFVLPGNTEALRVRAGGLRGERHEVAHLEVLGNHQLA